MSPWPRAAEVRVVAGLKESLFKRHRKNKKQAEDAWAGLVGRREKMLKDVQHGEPIPKHLRPKPLKEFNTLYLIPELPHRFRAIYEVSSASPFDPIIVTIIWIGDHSEYDVLFGYSTS